MSQADAARRITIVCRAAASASRAVDAACARRALADTPGSGAIGCVVARAPRNDQQGTSARARRRLIFLAFLLVGSHLVPEGGAALAQSKGDASRGADRAAACSACHGAPKSAPLAGMPSLAGQQPEFLVLQMFLLREGLRDVPPMAGMLNGWSDSDFSDVAAYFASQPAPKDTATRDPKLHARGAALLQALGCGSCHMSDFRGQRQVPRITGQREDYLAAALRAYRDNKRTGIDTSMNAAMYQVTDSDIQALAHALAHRQ